MKLNLRKGLALVAVLMMGGLLYAQDGVDHSYKPLTLKLNEDGSKYVRFIMWHQLWAETNNLSDANSDFSVTPSIRRSRFLAYSQISPKFLILTHWGLNNFNPSNMTSLGNNGDAPQMFLHDAWGEYKFSDKLYVGSGLHYWKGLTRLATQSTLNFMTLDQARPFTHWHSLGLTDQFARHIGVYGKGTIGKVQYTLAVNQRMNPANAFLGTASYNGDTTITLTGTGRSVIEGYVQYQFWDKESDKLPFKVGTYMGSKKVFNIGAGFFTQPNGALNSVTGEDQNVMHFAVDAFLDMPIGDKGALNAYASFINFNYGDNYISRWAGTGTNIYAHVGYFIKSAKLMPYIAFQQGNYEGYEEPMSSLDAGVNYFINGHNAKLTLEYHQITNDLNNGTTDISQIRAQFHVFL